MKTNNYNTRMLLSYLPILFLTISALIFIFFAMMNELNVRNAIKANKITTEYMANMLDSTLKSIDVDSRKLIQTSVELQQFLDGPPDRMLDFAASNALSGLMVQYSFIDSIYLYRAKDRRVLDQSTLRLIEEFPDRSYVQKALEQPINGSWTSPRSKEGERSTGAGEKVVSLGRNIPLDTGSLGYLVINVRVNSIEKFMDQMVDRKVTEAQLFDAGGKPFFQESKESSEEQGLHAGIVSDYTGWTYRTVIKGGRLFSILFQGGVMWIMLGLGAIVFAIGSMFYVTRRSYKPIEAIIHRINRFSSTVKENELREDKNEFAFIDQAIEKLITNNMEFQEKQQEHLFIRRQQFLQSLLSGDYVADGKTWEQERHHFGLSDGRFIVALLEIDHYVQFGLTYNQKDQSLFKFVVSSVAVEIAQQISQQVIVEWITKNQLVLLLNSGSGNDLEHHLLQLSEQIRAWIESHLDFTVTIGIGTAVEEVAGISRSFEEAAEAVSHKVTLGVNQIIDAVEVKGNTSGEWFLYLQLMQTAVRHLRMGELEWKNDFEQLFSNMVVHRLQKDDVDRLLHYFIFHLERELESWLPEAAKFWKQTVKPELLETLDKNDTLAELEDCFCLTFEQLTDHLLVAGQNRRHNVLMKEIRDYVAEHFTDPNLSLTLLSDLFQVNPKYLSQLFKEEIGENFSDFVITLRINYAKKLLKETNETVQDISEKTGYANAISFSRIFKKMVGISPGQYREPS
ncbi:two-component system response regulator YesN [Paenibacillus sp. V4I9]|uniref:helix-turn-helix domain-containing protein n=1 Tax=Paenibacillus sp. V4I9 TaxID=3042308 RepID=UPI00277E6DA7|nr:helix-turn-helix domain-containing protein [Paenibacillus sp. V4I9]MDQ0889035.1 two-component system response regulator YesN [Paenibacillus sp. V4I9]